MVDATFDVDSPTSPNPSEVSIDERTLETRASDAAFPLNAPAVSSTSLASTSLDPRLVRQTLGVEVEQTMVATPAMDVPLGLDSPTSVLSTSGHLILSILMSVMKSPIGTLPKQLWGLNRSIDLVAPRGFVIGGDESYEYYCDRATEAGRYPIVAVRTDEAFNRPIDIHKGIRSLVVGEFFNGPLDLPVGVEKLKLGMYFNRPIMLPPGLLELEFVLETGQFDYPLVLPSTLRKLVLSAGFDQPIILREGLECVVVGSNFNQQLILPSTLKVLDLSLARRCNHPLRLPSSLAELYLSIGFNRPITLPDTLHTAAFGVRFRQSQALTFGAGLRKLTWLCNQPLPPLPSTVNEVTFGLNFQQHVELEDGLEVVTFQGVYHLPLVLPASLKVIYMRYESPVVVLPPGCIRLEMTGE